MDTIYEIIDSMDHSIATIQRLSALAPLLDDGGDVYFSHAIEILYLISREIGHVEQMSTQVSRALVPRPRAVGDVE